MSLQEEYCCLGTPHFDLLHLKAIHQYIYILLLLGQNHMGDTITLSVNKSEVVLPTKIDSGDV